MTWTKPSPVVMLLLLLLQQGCCIYTFLGASLPPEIKTISLRFQSDVALGPPNLAEKLKYQLGDVLAQRTSLRQVHTKGDLQLEGAIKKYTYVSIAPTQSRQGGQGYQASVERLTIEVELTYINTYDEESSFSKKTFSQFADMPAQASRSNEEPRLIGSIFAQLIEDIFNETVNNW